MRGDTENHVAKQTKEEALQAKLDAANERIRDLEADASAATLATLAKWREPDYTGPLTGDQAAWRHANIKPATERTKPAQDVVTK